MPKSLSKCLASCASSILLMCISYTTTGLEAFNETALQHMRGYTAIVNESDKQDIILLEDENGTLYFPIGELAEYVDSKQLLPLAKNIYGCAPCIPLREVAEVSFDEAKNSATIHIRDRYRKAQLLGSTENSQPLSYGGGLATSFNLLGRYDEETDTEDYAADVDLGIGLGRIGNLYTSQIFFEDGESIRGQSFWETYFDRAMVQVQIGDVISHSDSFGGALQLGGLRIRRAFETRPGFNYHPAFKYFTEARLPGTLELLIDGQSVKKEEYDRGRLSFTSDIPTQNGEMTLVLTDVMGRRTIVHQPLFDTSDNLAPGVIDFDISYGAIREDENDYQDDYGSAFISTGITKYWTQSLAYQGNSDYELASTEFILSAGNHQLNIEGAYSNDNLLSLEGDATIVDYHYDIQGNSAWARLGANWFDTNEFSQFRGGVLTGNGKSLSISGGSGGFYTGLRGFEIGDLSGGTLLMGYAHRGWRLEADAQYLETDDYVATLTISYRPQGRNKPRIRIGHSWERDRRSAGADITGSYGFGSSSLGYQAAATQDYDIEDNESGTVDSRAGLSFRSNVVDIRSNYEDIRDQKRASARIKTGFVINRNNAFITSREVSQAYATVLTDRKGVRLKGGGYERKTDSDGEVSLPMPAFYESRVVIDRKSLAENDVLTQRVATVRVAKGNHAIVKMPVTQAPVIIHILHNGVNDIFLNGRPFVHNEFGAYINQYNAGGENELEVEGKRYTIELPVVKDELPVYEFDRATKRLIRVNELFRETE